MVPQIRHDHGGHLERIGRIACGSFTPCRLLTDEIRYGLRSTELVSRCVPRTEFSLGRPAKDNPL